MPRLLSNFPRGRAPFRDRARANLRSFKLNSSWHLTSTLRQTISAMDRSKTRRKKAIEENLAAQIAELKGDLSDKDLMDIAKSARYVCVASSC